MKNFRKSFVHKELGKTTRMEAFGRFCDTPGENIPESFLFTAWVSGGGPWSKRSEGHHGPHLGL
jgi:hypothetical protein